ncbi:unnamed protein product [Ixodes hexagonus]
MGCFKTKSPEEKVNDKLNGVIQQWKKREGGLIKILLLGAGESGKTTILKQMTILHTDGFTSEERREKAHEIRWNLLEPMKELTVHMAKLNPPIELEDPANVESFKFVKSLYPLADYDFPQCFYQHIKRLWSDAGIQECYRRSNEFFLIESSKYFLDQVDVISDENYVPTDQDILRCRKRTSNVKKVEFEAIIPKKYGHGIQEFWGGQDIGGAGGQGGRRWGRGGRGCCRVFVLVGSDNYWKIVTGDIHRVNEGLTGVNIIFGGMPQGSYLRGSGMILFLNKQDLLKEKVERGSKIEDHFPEYKCFKTHKAEENSSEYTRVRAFIRELFLNITRTEVPRTSLDRAHSGLLGSESPVRECFWHYTTATDTDNVQNVFNDVHSMIILSNLAKMGPS